MRGQTVTHIGSKRKSSLVIPEYFLENSEIKASKITIAKFKVYKVKEPKLRVIGYDASSKGPGTPIYHKISRAASVGRIRLGGVCRRLPRALRLCKMYPLGRIVLVSAY